MKIRVLFFARLKEMFGGPCLFLNLPEGATVGEAVTCLSSQTNEAAFNESAVLYAVNEQFENTDKKLKDGDELALMTPVSGG